jgi:hypothetical protein
LVCSLALLVAAYHAPTGSVRESYVVPNRSTVGAARDWRKFARFHGSIIALRSPSTTGGTFTPNRSRERVRKDTPDQSDAFKLGDSMPCREQRVGRSNWPGVIEGILARMTTGHLPNSAEFLNDLPFIN